MTAKTDFVQQIRDWAIRPDYSDNLVDGFMRTGETNLSRVLRVKEQIVVDGFTTFSQRVVLPSGWREIDYISFEGGKPLEYLDRHDFMAKNRPLEDKYTLAGNYLYLGMTIPEIGGQIEFSYYQNIPHLVDVETWMYTHYYDMYLQACLVPAFMYALEPERAAATSTYVSELVATANDEHRVSRISGSVLRLTRNRGNRIG